MFVCTQCICISFAFPDVCKTLVGIVVVPIPYPNFSMSSVAIPNIFNQFTVAMPDHNLLTISVTTTGDEPGILLGRVSSLIKGPSQHMIGSFKVFKAVMPATKMLCPTLQNGAVPNMIGITITPSQVKVMIFS